MSLDVEKMAIVEIVAELLSSKGVRDNRRVDSHIQISCDRLELPSYREFFDLFCTGAVEWFGFLDGFRLVPRIYRQYRPEFELARDRFFGRSSQYAARQQAIALAAGESLGSDVYGVGIVGASLGIGEADSRSAGRSLTVLSIDELRSNDLSMMNLIEEFSTRRFPQARRDEWTRAVQSLNPSKPIACDGCTNYHGQSYGGNKLVCAMHPTGVDGSTCGDWEGKSEPLL